MDGRLPFLFNRLVLFSCPSTPSPVSQKLLSESSSQMNRNSVHMRAPSAATLLTNDGASGGRMQPVAHVRTACHQRVAYCHLIITECRGHSKHIPRVFCLIVDVVGSLKAYLDRSLALFLPSFFQKLEKFIR